MDVHNKDSLNDELHKCGDFILFLFEYFDRSVLVCFCSYINKLVPCGNFPIPLFSGERFRFRLRFRLIPIPSFTLGLRIRLRLSCDMCDTCDMRGTCETCET